MREHLDEAITLDDLSRAAHVGKFYLVKLFRKRIGCTPVTYLMNMRVARARTLLAHGMPCGAAASEAGFCDQSHLNRWFKRVYGTSPGLYLRRQAPDRQCARGLRPEGHGPHNEARRAG
ncbi:MAG: helix-turn-helix transcriptional regulator [Polyangiaceae bacterium]